MSNRELSGSHLVRHANACNLAVYRSKSHPATLAWIRPNMLAQNFSAAKLHMHKRSSIEWKAQLSEQNLGIGFGIYRGCGLGI